MQKLLFAWVGQTDLNASKGVEEAGLGPIAPALDKYAFDGVHLLSNYPEKESQAYIKWLGKRTETTLHLYPRKLSSPMHFGEIHEAVVSAIATALTTTVAKQPGANAKTGTRNPELFFHISPGTSAMAAVWVILAKTRYAATLLQSSREAGVQIASVPFDISAEFLPELLHRPDRRLEELTAGLAPEAPEFQDIVCRSSVMKKVIARARRVAVRSVPVLIEGESGTGKELLARAIHAASPRKGKPFIAVNCGAIPENLIESELFGHEKGAFTGADRQRKGHFEEADGGTLFLDEIGDLPLSAQVKLLRVLQEKEITRLGSSTPIPVDVRILAATNRSLIEEVEEGRFREDLFYRLAVIVLKLPPLRGRAGDLGLLIDHLIDQVNQESQTEPGYTEKKLSIGARNLLLEQNWPGNVRELYNTLRRSAIWAVGTKISREDVAESLLPSRRSRSAGILDRALGEGLDVRELLASVARHYLERAMEASHANKTEAAKLIGLPNYQTLTNWLEKYGVKR